MDKKIMDLNRLRVLAGLDPIVESFPLNEAEKIKKGAFHKWLGKPEGEKITKADIERGLASDDEHVRKMAQFASNMTEGFTNPTWFVYSRCDRKSGQVQAGTMVEAVQQFAQKPVQPSAIADNPSKENPAKFLAEDKCEYVSYPLNTTMEDVAVEVKELEAILEKQDITEGQAAKLAHRKPGDNPATEGNHDSDIPKVTFLDKTPPANALVMTQVEFNDDTMAYNKTKMGVDVEEATKVKVPADVMKHVNKRLKELKAAIETYDEKGYDDKSVKRTAVDCLEKIKTHLEAGNIEQYRQAQVYYGTLMSPIFDMFPTQLINFLHSDKDTKKAII